MPNDLARGRNVTAEIKKSSSGDSSVGWLDEDFLRSLGADISDARFSPWLKSKQPKQLLFSRQQVADRGGTKRMCRVDPGTQDPQEVWLQLELERDLDGDHAASSAALSQLAQLRWMALGVADRNDPGQLNPAGVGVWTAATPSLKEFKS